MNARIIFDSERRPQVWHRLQGHDPAVVACQCCTWLLTGITGGTAMYTACMYTDRLILQVLAALFGAVMTALLVVFTAEAPRQPPGFQALLWIMVSALMAISVWGTARSIQETIPLDQLRVPGTAEQQWHGMLAFGLLLDLLRAFSAWTAAAITSRKRQEAEAEERKQHLKQIRKAQEAALFPLSEAVEAPLPTLSEAEAAPVDQLKDHFKPGEIVSIRMIQEQLSLGFQKARNLKDAAVNAGLLIETGKGLAMVGGEQ